MLQHQLVLYGHILRLEKSDPLWMATFDDNLNQQCPPRSSKTRGHPRSFWVQEVGAIARDRVLRTGRKSEKISTRSCTRLQLVEEDKHD